MIIATELSNILNGIGALLVAALGVWIALLRPRTRVNLALGAFTFGFGAFVVPVYLLAEFSPAEAAAVDAFRLAMQAVSAVGLVALLRIFPRPLRRSDRTGLLLAGGIVSLELLTFTIERVIDPWVSSDYVAAFPALNLVDVAERLANVALFTLIVAAPVLLTWRYTRLADPAAQTQSALMTAALLVYVGFITGAGGSEPSDPIRDPLAMLSVAGRAVACVLVGILWLRATATSAQPARARNLALLAFGMPLVGLLYVAAGKGFGGYGITRTLFVLVLAYAILRSQLLGLDVKVRFAISKSTIAAIFVAVFFLASEGAQLAFGRENQIVGLVAAGALVFAMSPLQRAADRLAERAVPSSSAPGPGLGPASSGKEQAYRAALRAALRDRVLTREEEIGLAHLSDELGLTHKRAREIWHETQAEAKAKAEERAR